MKYLRAISEKRIEIYKRLIHFENPNIHSLFEYSKKALKNDGKLIFLGNGGSFSIAEHISAEFTGRYKKERNSLPSIVLGSNSASLSAIANDYGYENIFCRELSSLGNKFDVLIAMSTSGKSSNILKVLEEASLMGISNFLLTGKNNIEVNPKTKVIYVPSSETALVQEIHLSILHQLCDFIDNSF